jgi:DNA-directed RNA polymerase specialized sigma24 family protein
LKLDENSRSEGAAQFRTTRWSVVLLSAQSQAPGSKAALAELCKLYWFPLYAFVRRRGYCPADAQDLAQGFFLHLLDHKSLAEVDPRKGKFRSFLLASIKTTFRRRPTAAAA